MASHSPTGTSPPGWTNRIPYQHPNGHHHAAATQSHLTPSRAHYSQSPSASYDSSYASGFPNGSQASMSQVTAATSNESAAPAQPPMTGPSPMVYLATYSNVPVYEITVRGIAVMRRRIDGYLNATQILKVAGVEKARRTKILEKEILTGEHEKVQGGYGKYQGTWIPLRRAQELAAGHNVAHLLRPVLEFDPRTADQIPTAGPKKRPNPNAPANSAYFKSGPGAAGSSPSSNQREPSPVKGPTQQPRFLQLRPLPSPGREGTADSHAATANILGALGGGSSSVSEGIPPGSTPSQRQALSSYSQYGYTPQNVPLPKPAAIAGTKRSEPDAAGDTSMEDVDSNKRARPGTPDATTPEGTDKVSAAGTTFGPSPVKDLAALAGPGSSLRGASHPQLHRVPLGPPDELARRSGNARFSDRPQPLRPQDEGEKRMRERLVALFRDEVTEDGTSAEPRSDGSAIDTDKNEGSSPGARLSQLLVDLRAAVSLGGVAGAVDEGGPVPCVDTIIDDHGHTALHWASALCRLPLVKMLVAKSPAEGGSNVQAGNYAGETALHRSVLVTNSYDMSLFPMLLELLSPSLHTRDFKSRTVLHHIALVAAMRGRATPARYYLATVLEYIEKHEGGRFASLVDAQDEDGETALGIAARQGNNSMVKMLLEVGARKDLANCFGLKPSDWGIDAGSTQKGSSSDADNQLTPQTKEGLREGRSDVVTALMRPPQAPVQKSQDVLDQMRSILDDLSATSNRELSEKVEALDTAQSHLRSASRELTRRRGMISNAQARVAELEESRIRTLNLKRRLAKILPAPRNANGAPQPVDEATPTQIANLLKGTQSADIDSGLTNDLGSADADKLIMQRFLLSWFTASNADLNTEIDDVLSEAKLREEQCRKVVAMYSRVDESKLDGILEDLVAAIESYSDVDIARVAGFLAKATANKAAPVHNGKSSTPSAPQAVDKSGDVHMTSSSSPSNAVARQS
ncbi:unnamed protein product [Sympodiomycopsis kandeliae]